MCPGAHQKHLRMFEAWRLDYEQYLETKQQAATATEALYAYQSNDVKPILPFLEIDALKREFARLDYKGLGYVDLDDIMGSYDLPPRDAVAAHDSSADGFIDET